MIDEVIRKISEDVGVIEKSKAGFGFKYAALPDIIAILKPVLQKHGVTYSQNISSNIDGTLVVTTIRFNDEIRVCSLLVPWDHMALPKMTAIQSFGGSITYLRRYGLTSAFELLTEEDADSKEEARKALAEKKTPWTDEQREKVDELIKETATDVTRFLEYYKKQSMDDFTAAEYRSVISSLNQKKGAKNG
jgi:hypothetical protein